MSAYNYVVDKYHVGTSNLRLLRAIIRSRPKRAWRKATREQRHAFLRGCLAAHAENRAIYRQVMGGIR